MQTRRSTGIEKRIAGLLGAGIIAGAVGLLVGCVVDRLGFGTWTVVLLNFVRFNVVQNAAGFYGTHPWHWYFSQALPIMCFSTIPFLVLGLFPLLFSAQQLQRNQSGSRFHHFHDDSLEENERKHEGLKVESESQESSLKRREKEHDHKRHQQYQRSEDEGEREGDEEENEKEGRLKPRLLLWIIGFVVAVYSALGHKEFRFILPILPLLFIIAGYGATYLLFLLDSAHQASSEERTGKQETQRGSKQDLTTWKNVCRRRKQNRHKTASSRSLTWSRRIIVATIVLNIPMAVYFCSYHQRGVMDLMTYLRDAGESVGSVVFLMPCHSTPLYSHLHQPIVTRYLQCLPPLSADPRDHYDEADDFFARPLQFLQETYQHQLLPSHFALFSPVHAAVEPFLTARHYHLVKSFWHTATPVDSRHGDVLLFQRDPILRDHLS